VIHTKTKVPQKRDFVYGWVSKYQGNEFPYTILKRLFTNAKIFLNNFINIYSLNVDSDRFYDPDLTTFFLSVITFSSFKKNYESAETVMNKAFQLVRKKIFFNCMIIHHMKISKRNTSQMA